MLHEDVVLTKIGENSVIAVSVIMMTITVLGETVGKLLSQMIQW